MLFSFSIGRVVTLLTVLLICNIYSSKSHLCTQSICKLCCKPTQSGCVNGFVKNYNFNLSSVNLACQDCNCDNPEIGCGWVGRRFNRVECDSCNVINSLCEMNPDLPISGCGKTIVDGALIYTS